MKYSKKGQSYGWRVSSVCFFLLSELKCRDVRSVREGEVRSGINKINLLCYLGKGQVKS